jgi:hypothetical protein
MRSWPCRWMVGSVVPTCDFDRLRHDRAHALGDAGVGQGNGDLAVRPVGEGQLGHAAHGEQAGADVVLQALHGRHGGVVLGRVGQFHHDAIGLGGDEVAYAGFVRQLRADIAAQRLQPLLDDRFAVHAEQQVRAALQVEAEHHGLLGHKIRPGRQLILREEIREGEENPEQRDEEDDRCTNRGELHGNWSC